MKFKRTGSKEQGLFTWTYQDYRIEKRDKFPYNVYMGKLIKSGKFSCISYHCINSFEKLADAKSYILSRNKVDTTSLARFFEI